MFTSADLKAEDQHIRVGEAFVLNQKRIIAERAAAGLPTARDEHWLSVFTAGLAKHRMRRAWIRTVLSYRADPPAAMPAQSAGQPYYGQRDLGLDRRQAGASA